ncbi:MAG TPA: thioredoxin domain-containing protein [Steroidobacteraceae bacterium]|nr:thioredoxin domain-containing protein [Gammaproteobacteria bacterium]HEV2286583.1 thioredoxin domain-containing protein [Steroidobacteraceae bacterium]
MYTNHLSGETSPYLLQHAHNPVEWYPWGNEALERARRERKPIHLSIGYAACHWCHVMAHESFEDEATARLLNENFVNIKVDREERPDIDRIYQIAQQMLTQRGGGWPLTMFLAHDDQRPFFGGTYFPREARYGLPGFRDLLPRVVEFYRSHEPQMRAQNAALVAALGDINPPPAPASTALTDAPLRSCRAQLAQNFDLRYGGFGGAPKFPQPKALERLLRDWRASAPGAEAGLQSLYMASFSLRHMGEGGIFDQLGGGFCRYAVDERWMIPHFEKMLYDNGALLALYANPSLITADLFFGQVALETAGWALRRMQSPEGGFYSSLDADSEGHEGKFYVWDREEVRSALSAEEFAVFAPRYGLDQPPNFEGRWHLYVAATVEQIAAALQRAPAEVAALLGSSRSRLLALRAQRVSPGRDEKILTSWNALMIRGLAIAARVLRQDALAAAAGRALDFLRAQLWRDGRLLATYKDGRAHLNAYLDDYVYLVDAVLELQQLRFRADELEFARQLIEVVLGHFEDPAAGGFFFTSDDHEQLIHRPKSFSDDATPSGNGIAALVLQRLGYLLGEPRYLTAAERTLRAAWPALEKQPPAHATLVNALEELLQPPEIVILRGEPAAIEGWQRELAQIFAPRRLVLAIPADADGLPPALAEKTPRGAAVAYVCRGSTCSAPVESLPALIANLHADRAVLAVPPGGSGAATLQ